MELFSIVSTKTILVRIFSTELYHIFATPSKPNYLKLSISVALIGIFIRVRKVLFSTIIRSKRWTGAGVNIQWLNLSQHLLVERNGGTTFLHGLSDSQLDFQNFLNDVFWKPLLKFQTGWNYVFLPYGILEKEFLAEMICEGMLWIYFRKGWSENIIESLRFLRCVLSFISLVNMLLWFMITGICSTSTYFDWWHS